MPPVVYKCPTMFAVLVNSELSTPITMELGCFSQYTTPIVICVFVLFLFSFARQSHTRKRQLSLPPGPKSWPIIGNMLAVPKIRPWLAFHEWSNTYGMRPPFISPPRLINLVHFCLGDIVFLSLPAQPTVILDTVGAAIELLDRRSAIYSSRPTLVMDTL